jgi:hypothetical protein
MVELWVLDVDELGFMSFGQHSPQSYKIALGIDQS